jgi:hypothetical protein
VAVDLAVVRRIDTLGESEGGEFETPEARRALICERSDSQSLI